MRIAIVIDSLLRAGAEREALNAVLELTRAGRDVELIYYHDTGPKHVHSAFEQARVTLLPKDGQPIRFIGRLGRHLKRGGFDLVHGFTSSPSAYAYLAARLGGVRAVLGGIQALYDFKGVYHLTNLWVNRVVAGWVVNSHATARSMVTAVGARPDRVFVVYNGIDAAEFRSGLTPAEARRKLGLDAVCPTAAIIARLRPQKNHRLFLDAAALVAKDLPDARFLVVGDGDLRSELEAQARALDLTGRVLFLGNRGDIPDVLAATDVSVLTSHYEGMANALMEAMATGIPVLTTDYPGVEELLSDGQEGLVVPRGNAQAVAGGIVRLLRDAALRRRMGENGRRAMASRFSMEAMGASLYAVYEQCLAGLRRT